jgi:hypothetical protein
MKARQIRKASFRLWLVASALWAGFVFIISSENEDPLPFIAGGSVVFGIMIGGLGWVVSAFFDE